TSKGDHPDCVYPVGFLSRAPRPFSIARRRISLLHKALMVTELATSQGVLELHPKGFGFLRNPVRHYVAQPGDAYVPAPLIHRYSLREGLLVAGPTEAALRGNGPRLTAIEQIEGGAPDSLRRRNFDELTP